MLLQMTREAFPDVIQFPALRGEKRIQGYPDASSITTCIPKTRDSFLAVVRRSCNYESAVRETQRCQLGRWGKGPHTKESRKPPESINGKGTDAAGGPPGRDGALPAPSLQPSEACIGRLTYRAVR